MSRPDIDILVSSYNRPNNLRRVLASIAAQREVEGRFGVVVTDDGSTDDIRELVENFAASVEFPVRFTTHPHEGFQVSRCRNEGVAASSAPYLLFIDGDCLIPPDHIAIHLARRRPGWVMSGGCVYLDEETSKRVTLETIQSGEYQQWASPDDIRQLKKIHRKAAYYTLIRHPTKPKCFGGNTAVWRADYENVNGHDENFVGWGGEDDDLRMRLFQSGVRVASLYGWTWTCHLWHPPSASTPKVWSEGGNMAYFQRAGRLVRCRNGLRKRALEDLSIQIVGHPEQSEWRDLFFPAVRNKKAWREEIEVLFLPGRGTFSGKADCNVLVLCDRANETDRRAKKAHIVLDNREGASGESQRKDQLFMLDNALQRAA